MLYDLPVTDSTSSHDEVSRQIKEQFTFLQIVRNDRNNFMLCH